MERYYHKLREEFQNSIYEVNKGISKLNYYLNKYGIPQLDSISASFDDQTPIENLQSKLMELCVFFMSNKEKLKLNAEKGYIVLKALEQIMESVGSLGRDKALYENTVFHYPEDKVLSYEYSYDEALANMEFLSEDVFVLESEFNVAGIRYLCSTTITPAWKNGVYDKDKPFQYNFIACDLWNNSIKKFEHLSSYILKKGTTKVWMQHAEETLHKKFDTASLFFQGDYIDVQPITLQDLVELSYGPRDFNGEINDSVSATMALHIMSAIHRYSELIQKEKTVIYVGSSNKKSSKHKASKHTKDISIVNKDVFIPMSSIDSVKKIYDKKEWQGGHHASPIPHDVTGHWRCYKTGKKVWIEGYHKNCAKHGKGTISKVIEID